MNFNEIQWNGLSYDSYARVMLDNLLAALCLRNHLFHCGICCLPQVVAVTDTRVSVEYRQIACRELWT